MHNLSFRIPEKNQKFKEFTKFIEMYSTFKAPLPKAIARITIFQGIDFLKVNKRLTSQVDVKV